MACYRWDGEQLILQLHIQPRAARNEIAGRYGDALKVRLSAPPVDDRANRELVRFLAECCDVPRQRVSLVAGHGSRRKRVRIDAPRRLPRGVEPPDGCT
ncbi:MAG TPA: YggU family protein [Gammaproteobacteria bacterium]|nr:YggU family protein [Gammaproteobacteria bacterium]